MILLLQRDGRAGIEGGEGDVSHLTLARGGKLDFLPIIISNEVCHLLNRCWRKQVAVVIGVLAEARFQFILDVSERFTLELLGGCEHSKLDSVDEEHLSSVGIPDPEVIRIECYLVGCIWLCCDTRKPWLGGH